MKLIILKENLRQGLGAVEKATTESANLPILKNIPVSVITQSELQQQKLPLLGVRKL